LPYPPPVIDRQRDKTYEEKHLEAQQEGSDHKRSRNGSAGRAPVRDSLGTGDGSEPGPRPRCDGRRNC
jgi:hypothetical protein